MKYLLTLLFKLLILLAQFLHLLLQHISDSLKNKINLREI